MKKRIVQKLLVTIMCVFVLCECRNTNLQSKSSDDSKTQSSASYELLSSVNHCAVEKEISEIMSWTLAEWYELTGHDYSSNQSCAVFKKYAFLFAPDSPDAAAVIVDLDNPSITYSASMPSTVHANSAQFIDVYYDENDYFPLLILSNCEANGKASSVNVLRITKAGESFSFSLLKKLFFSTPGMVDYGSSLAFDISSRKLISIYNPNGNWRVTTNNPIIIKQFNEPEWLDEIDTVYDDDDGTIIASYPFFVFQGIGYYNDKLYVGCSFPYDNDLWAEYEGSKSSKQSVLVLDGVSGEIINSIPMIDNREVEGVSVHDNCLYVSQRNNTVISEEIATWLYKIEL